MEPEPVSQISLEPQTLVKVPVRIGKSSFEALLDTGSRVNLIRASTVPASFPIDPTTAMMVKGLGGKDTQSLGSLTLEVDFYHVPIATYFQVVPDTFMQFSLVLGTAFLSANGVSLNFHSRTLTIVDPRTRAKTEISLDHDSNIPCTRSQNIPCFSSKTLRIPAHTVCKVEVTWESPRYRKECLQCSKEIEYVYESSLTCNHESIYCSGVLNQEADTILVASQEVPLVLKKGRRLGHLHTLVNVGGECVTANLVNAESGKSTPVTKMNLDIGPSLTTEEKQEVVALLEKYSDVFGAGKDDVGRGTIGSHSIKLYSYSPIYQRLRRFPEPVAEEIEKQCQQLHQADVIEPSSSPWNSPIVPVRKPDGSLRLCLDYRKLNQVTIPDRSPMPNLTDSIYSLHGVKYFTSLDLVRGYYQMSLDPDSREFTAFSTSRSHWQFKRLPFGLCNAPAAFQRQMQQVLSGFPHSKVVVYIDDILIMEKGFVKHLELVGKVLMTLSSHGIKINPEKCSWVQEKVKFLGHQISSKGLEKLPEYIEKVKSFPKPTTVKQLREFLGLINFQRKFIPDCALIGRPLFAETGGSGRKKLKWSDDMEVAFEKLKGIMAQDITLAFPDYSSDAPPLELHVDASAEGAGACLSQPQENQRQIIAYSSMGFNTTQKRYSTIERELAAIRWGVKTFKAFLYGQHFKLYTDHQPLVYLQNMRVIDSRLARTLEDLADFDFEIIYTPGRDNQAADAFSRLLSNDTPEVHEHSCDGLLPEGLLVMEKVEGGGDSLLESLILAYRALYESYDGDISLLVEKPCTLRRKLISVLLQSPKKYSLAEKKLQRKLRAMQNPGIMLPPEVIQAFAELYSVTVMVHYGSTNPVVYTSSPDNMSKRVHLQCLAGVHYNPVRETRRYKGTTPVIPEKNNDDPQALCVEVEEVRDDEAVDMESSPCTHLNSQPHTPRVVIGKKAYCALLDSGAEVNLVSQAVVEGVADLQMEDFGSALIKGISGDINLTVALTRITGCFVTKKFPIGDLPCAVLPAKDLPACFVLGMKFLRSRNLIIDWSCHCLMLDDEYLCDLPHLQPNLDTNGIYLIRAETVIPDNDIVSGDTIFLSQHDSPKLRRLQSCLLRELPVSGLPRSLKQFKYMYRRMCLKDNLIMVQIEDALLPVVSFPLLVDLVLHTHLEMAHVGALKVLGVLQPLFWHPQLRKVVTDVCTTCSMCQKTKPTSKTNLPPTLKIITKSPFELMAIDLVALPPSSGYIGLLVLVDHFSKWLALAPIRNKKAATITALLKFQIFPSLLRLPDRILSDNGPEFNSIEFTSLMEEMNILHVRTTPYMPSSNGAVERVNRSILGLLRSATKQSQDWVKSLPRVIMTYNNTVHSETKAPPSSFLLTKPHNKRLVPCINPETKTRWAEGHPQYTPFRVGQPVLKRIPSRGNLLSQKLEAIYDGPYRVLRVNANEVTYEVQQLESSVVLQAHHRQLKLWKEPPRYILNHLKKFPLTTRWKHHDRTEREILEAEPTEEEEEPVYPGIILPPVMLAPAAVQQESDGGIPESLDLNGSPVEVNTSVGMGPFPPPLSSSRIPDIEPLPDGQEHDRFITPSGRTDHSMGWDISPVSNPCNPTNEEIQTVLTGIPELFEEETSNILNNYKIWNQICDLSDHMVGNVEEVGPESVHEFEGFPSSPALPDEDTRPPASPDFPGFSPSPKHRILRDIKRDIYKLREIVHQKRRESLERLQNIYQNQSPAIERTDMNRPYTRSRGPVEDISESVARLERLRKMSN